MDMLKEVINCLDQSGFDDFTKIRWIYLYVCEKFSYDVRYIYATKDLKEKIYNKKVDLTNVQDYEYVCYTYAHILVDLLNIYGFESEIVKEVKNRDITHVYVVVKCNDKLIKLDPTTKHDTTRVKMKNGTLDFQSLVDDPTFYDDLNEADNVIKSYKKSTINDDEKYDYDTIMKIMAAMTENFSKNKVLPNEMFFDKLKVIFEIVNAKKSFTRYDDIDYYFSYLLKKFKINEKKIYVKPAIFFRKDDKSMKDIINLILVEYDNMPPLFFIMEKIDKNYQIREIAKDEVLEKLELYSNWRVDEFFKNKAKLSKTVIKL